MAGWLLDTNILVRRADPKAADHALATGAVTRLLASEERCYLTAQVIVEFWTVATRPIGANGLGWNVPQAKSEVDLLLDQFPLLEETPGIFENWLTLVGSHGVTGKRAHDARLLAVMQAHGVRNLLTLNIADFPTASGITVVHPRDLR